MQTVKNEKMGFGPAIESRNNTVKDNNMDRREALKKAACSVAVIAAPVSAAALSDPDEGGTEILRLFRERCRMCEVINFNSKNNPNMSDEDLDAEVDVMRAVEAQIMDLPSTCAADFAAKVIIDTAEAGCLSEWETGTLWKEARALTGCAV